MTIKSSSVLPGTMRQDIDPRWLLATGSANAFAAGHLVDPLVHVRVGPGLAAEAGTALYIHSERIIEIDSNVMLPGADPDRVDFMMKSWRLLHPLAVGSLLHECSHELATRDLPNEMCHRWGLAGLPYTQAHVDIMMTLEEHRCEAIFAKKYPQARPFFARLVLDLISRNIKLHKTPYSAAGLLALVMGREASGTLTADQVAPFRTHIESVLTTYQVEALMSLIARYDKAAFSDATEVHNVITEWLKVLKIDTSDPEEPGVVFIMITNDDASTDPAEPRRTRSRSGAYTNDTPREAPERSWTYAALHNRDAGSNPTGTVLGRKPPTYPAEPETTRRCARRRVRQHVRICRTPREYGIHLVSGHHQGRR